jgi:maltooligosyltrehalose trehalohydrolase
MSALFLLMPSTPMLFQGQEFASSAPFLYFADFAGDLGAAVRKGRAEFLMQFPSILEFEKHAKLDDPSDTETFRRCKLDFAEREEHAQAYSMHRDLLTLRRESPAFRRQSKGGVDGAVLGAAVFVLRFFAELPDDERLVVVNLGRDMHSASFAEPLVAPPAGRAWREAWSSEDPAYGGAGVPDMFPGGRWNILAESAHVLSPVEARATAPWQRKRRTA